MGYEYGEDRPISCVAQYKVDILEDLAAREGLEQLVSPVDGDKVSRYRANRRRSEAMAVHPSNGVKA